MDNGTNAPSSAAPEGGTRQALIEAEIRAYICCNCQEFYTTDREQLSVFGWCQWCEDDDPHLDDEWPFTLEDLRHGD